MLRILIIFRENILLIEKIYINNIFSKNHYFYSLKIIIFSLKIIISPIQTNSSTVTSTTATTSAAAAATRIEDLNITAANEITNKKFSASIGWCRRFMKRYGLVIRRISGSGRSFKSDTVHTIHEYLIQLRETVKRYSPDEILSMDETSHNMDAVGRNTVSSDVHFCSRSCQRK